MRFCQTDQSLEMTLVELSAAFFKGIPINIVESLMCFQCQFLTRRNGRETSVKN